LKELTVQCTHMAGGSDADSGRKQAR